MIMINFMLLTIELTTTSTLMMTISMTMKTIMMMTMITIIC
jgi:hypothetical protein